MAEMPQSVAEMPQPRTRNTRSFDKGIDFCYTTTMMNKELKMNKLAAFRTARIVLSVATISIAFNWLLFYDPELFVGVLVAGLFAFAVKMTYDIQVSRIDCERGLEELKRLQ